MKLSLLLAVLSLSILAGAQTYKFSTLVNFPAPSKKGPQSPSSLILGSDGNLYGTTYSGGANGMGTIFESTPKGVLSVLHAFNGSDGSSPTSLVRDTKGNLYGTTQTTIFKMTAGKNGTYAFSTLSVPAEPPHSLTLDSAGNLYGYTCTACFDENVTLFEIPAGGSFTSLAQFYTVSQLGNLINRSGSLYGTVYGDYGVTSWGYVFEWTAQAGMSILHTFDNNDGEYPDSIRQDAAGNIYGSTMWGGTFDGGTLFKISSTNGFSTLYNFCSADDCADGYAPSALVLDSKGNIFGSQLLFLTPSHAPTGGVTGRVFQYASSGALNILYSGFGIFGGRSDLLPYMVMDKSGNLYGLSDRATGRIYKLAKQ